MEIANRRERNHPVFISAEKVNGGSVGFSLDRGRRLNFETVPGEGLLAFGLRVEARGTVRLKRGFEVHDVELVLRPPSGGIHERNAPFEEGDRDTALNAAVSRAISDAANRAIALKMEKLAAAWLDLADDVALDRMAYRSHCVDELAELGPTVSWKDEHFYQEQIETAEREVASLDEEAYAHSWLHASRPGYVVVCEGKPTDRGERRFREDRGTGWVQRYVCIHLAEAQRFVGEMGRDIDDIRVERIRIVDGKPFAVVEAGLVEPKWSLEEPVLTGSIMAR